MLIAYRGLTMARWADRNNDPARSGLAVGAGFSRSWTSARRVAMNGISVIRRSPRHIGGSDGVDASSYPRARGQAARSSLVGHL